MASTKGHPLEIHSFLVEEKEGRAERIEAVVYFTLP
jgi:hypothetical protein